MDADNIRSGLKSALDSLFCQRRNNGEGLTADDSDEFLEEGPITQETGRRWAAAPEVLLTVEEL
jgi:hypothetical protein